MSKLLDYRFADDIAEEVIRFLDEEYTPDQLIPGLMRAVEIYLAVVPNNDEVIDEIVTGIEPASRA